MTKISSSEPRSFSMISELDEWLKMHHQQEKELWVRIYKKASGIASVTWNDCVIASLTWGWIDGHKKSLDETSFLQRITPRRARSNWSKRNREHAERLIADGQMQTAGLAQVQAAINDGRWENAYAGSADMEIPQDFIDAIRKKPKAMRFFDTLNRANLFAIYHRLHSAKKPETRAARIERIVAQLEQGKAIH